MMADSLIRDPLFNEFDEMQREAEKFAINIYEPHDGKPFNQDSSAWNKSYLDSVILDLRKNFSRERAAHVKQICSFVYKDKIKANRRGREASAAYQRQSNSVSASALHSRRSSTGDNAYNNYNNTGQDRIESRLIQRLAEAAYAWHSAVMDLAEYVADNADNGDTEKFEEYILGKLRQSLTQSDYAQEDTDFMNRIHKICVDGVIKQTQKAFKISRSRVNSLIKQTQEIFY